MRRFTFHFISIGMLLAILLSSCKTPVPMSHQLIVLSAKYGAGSKRVDVSSAVQSLVERDTIHLDAPWDLGQVDPAFGEQKDVQITYRLNGQVRTVAFKQSQPIILP
jgi:hypothetical protein